MNKFKKSAPLPTPLDWMRHAEKIGQAMESSREREPDPDVGRQGRQKKLADKFRVIPSELTDDA